MIGGMVRAARLAAGLLLALPLAACLGIEGKPPRGFEATLPPGAALLPAPGAGYDPTTPAPAPAAANGAIYRAGHFGGLVTDDRARNVGDLVTIVLTERTQASKEATASAGRDSNYGIRLPDAKPFSLLPPGLFNAGSSSEFDGSGAATQSNQLRGEITVTVAQVLPGGILVVRGQKVVKLNRGDEYVNISGLVRRQDIGPDNRVASTRVADARIGYSGVGELAAQSRQGWLGRLLNYFNPF